MSQKIDPREVLTYLNELGYTNISAQQLKEFIKDLKKLIKYESKPKKSNIDKENIFPTSNYSTTYYKDRCWDNLYSPHKPNNVNVNEDKPNNVNEYKPDENDIYNSLYNQPTVASKAKEVPRQERQISVHIIRPKSKAPKHDHCIHTRNQQVTDDESQLQFVENIAVASDGSRVDIETESTIRSIRPCSKQTVISHGSNSKPARPKNSFMRPSYSKPINRCDPVALYHYYQKEWKKQKFPGQETHSDLRWAVREKLLSSHRGDTVSRPSTSRKSYNSWKV